MAVNSPVRKSLKDVRRQHSALVCVCLAWVVARHAVYNDKCFVVFEDSDTSSEKDFGSYRIVREIDISCKAENTCQDTLCRQSIWYNRENHEVHYLPMRKSHCHPAKPPRPLRDSKPIARGPARAPAILLDAQNSAKRRPSSRFV